MRRRHLHKNNNSNNQGRNNNVEERPNTPDLVDEEFPPLNILDDERDGVNSSHHHGAEENRRTARITAPSLSLILPVLRAILMLDIVRVGLLYLFGIRQESVTWRLLLLVVSGGIDSVEDLNERIASVGILLLMVIAGGIFAAWAFFDFLIWCIRQMIHKPRIADVDDAFVPQAYVYPHSQAGSDDEREAHYQSGIVVNDAQNDAQRIIPPLADKIANLKEISEFLTEAGYPVTMAKDPEQVIANLKEISEFLTEAGYPATMAKDPEQVDEVVRAHVQKIRRMGSAMPRGSLQDLNDDALSALLKEALTSDRPPILPKVPGVHGEATAADCTAGQLVDAKPVGRPTRGKPRGPYKKKQRTKHVDSKSGTGSKAWHGHKEASSELVFSGNTTKPFKATERTINEHVQLSSSIENEPAADHQEQQFSEKTISARPYQWTVNGGW